jgi:hypothetical protein
MPCPVCNTDELPEMPNGFKTETDKNGTRH